MSAPGISDLLDRLHKSNDGSTGVASAHKLTLDSEVVLNMTNIFKK